MKQKISRVKAQGVARALLDMDREWARIFGDIGLQDLNYGDLFFEMWQHENQAFAKTALYDYMPGVSRRTAVRYVQALIDTGWLIEHEAEHDRRVKLVQLSVEIEQRLVQFLAFVHHRFAILQRPS
ncbi:MarR family transcriptional regulator [Burkholderia vietnamiensis]